MSPSPRKDPFWQPISLRETGEAGWDINDARIRARKEGDEWLIAHRVAPDKQRPQDEAAESDSWPEEWTRYIANTSSHKLVLTPLPPDRPAVVNPESGVQVLPGNEGTFFINIPVWIEIAVFVPERVKLIEVPGSVLPTTWFGGPVEGLLSYALETRAGRKVVPPRNPDDTTIVVPLRIKNLSREILDLKDLCLHCEHLSVYQGKTRLWSNEVYVEFQADLLSSKITYQEKPPAFEQLREYVAAPRVRARQDILFRSFSFFRNFSA